MMKRVVGLREERRVRGFLYLKAADAGGSPRYDLARPILDSQTRLRIPRSSRARRGDRANLD